MYDVCMCVCKCVCVCVCACMCENRSDDVNQVIIIIMHVYIVSKPSNSILRWCTILLSLTQTCFNPAHTSTSKGEYNTC